MADLIAQPHFAAYLTLAVMAWERDPGAAALQTRREELNRDRGWLPAAQDDEQHMDLASQCGRWPTGCSPRPAVAAPPGR